MSNFNYMDYHCTKVIEEAEQDAIHNMRWHELHHMFPDNEVSQEALDTLTKYLTENFECIADNEVSQEALDTLTKYLTENFECIDASKDDSVEDIGLFIGGIVAMYLDTRSMAGWRIAIDKKDKAMMKYFEMTHGKYLMETPESYEYNEELDSGDE